MITSSRMVKMKRDGETLQGRTGRTWNGLDGENERERGATDDS